MIGCADSQMIMKTSRRTFFKIGSVLGIIPALVLNTEAQPVWDVMVCEAGTSECENLAAAWRRATMENREIRFTFNYHRHFCVFPSGRVERVDDMLFSNADRQF